MNHRLMKLETIKKKPSTKELKRARKYVKRLKSWYWFIPFNLIVTATFGALCWLMHSNGEPNIILWVLMSSPLALWVIFIVEGIVLKTPKSVRSWEERKMKQWMNQGIQMSKYE